MVFFVALASVCAGCDDTGADGGAGGSSPSSSPSAAPAPGEAAVLEAAEEDEPPAPAEEAPTAKASDDDVVSIPGGSFVAGSTPGDTGRDPSLEPALLEVKLGAFDIDRDLARKEGSNKPTTGLTRDEAKRACEKRGRRLCTELEWERACKGPDESTYPGRQRWDPKCVEEPARCASGFGVADMGIRYREWTASDVEPVADVQKGAAAVRGGTRSASGPEHRCAARQAVDADDEPDDVSYRCCGGPPNAPTIPSPKWKQTFRTAEMSAERATDLFSQSKHLAELSKPATYFEEDDAVRKVLARAKLTEEPRGYRLTTEPLLWNPAPGEDILLLTGQSGENAFIVALHVLPDGRHRFGSTLVLKGDKGPVVLAYDTSVRRRLRWATCWECPGEWGKITYRKENRVVITQE